jgi:hypothetical protein
MTDLNEAQIEIVTVNYSRELGSSISTGSRSPGR